MSTTTCTLPLWPGAIVLSKSATVQPQAGRTSVIWSGAVPSLRITKSWAIFSPFGWVPTSLIGSGTTAFGLFGLAAGAAGAAVFAGEASAASAGAATSQAAQSARMAVPIWRFIRACSFADSG